MKSSFLLSTTIIATIFAFSNSALADKPSWAGGGKAEKRNEQAPAGQGRQPSGELALRFSDDSRRIIGDYYGTRAKAGKCPPGLAKKKNGCLPPGQAKKWAMNQTLPPDLKYGNLPPELLKRLPPPPPEHRYVQIAGDILMIAVGTSMVVDAIEDIFR